MDMTGLALAIPLLLALLPLVPAAGGSAAGFGSQEGRGAGPLANAAPVELLGAYSSWQPSANGSLSVLKTEVVVRLSGAAFLPFSLDTQRVLIRAFREVLTSQQGPAELTMFRESYPDPAAPAALREAAPGVDLGFFATLVTNVTADGVMINPPTVQDTGLRVYAAFLAWRRRVVELGKWPGVTADTAGTILSLNFNPARIEGGYVLQPLVVLDLTLAVTLGGESAGDTSLVSAEQASVVEQMVEQLVVAGRYGSLVEVMNRTEAKASSLRGTGSVAQAQPQVLLQVTMYACRDNATVASPECEQQVLNALLAQELPEASQQQLQAAGVQGLAVHSIAERPPPAPPAATAAAAGPWQPWHLDRIDQHSATLDGRYSANATGTGVNVYIISSGVRGDHEEFKPVPSDEAPASRVVAAWGYLGLDPELDCPDYDFWYSYGTYAASLCCGAQVGVAKNATIHSVRFRERCMSDPVIWSAGALPSALDLVLSTFNPPGVVLIDTWWGLSRVPNGTDGLAIREAIIQRLNRFQDANITVVAAAGPAPDIVAACDNVIAAHDGVISVGSSDAWDQRTALSATNSSCIDIWAPSGGVGVGLIGASAETNASYTRMIPRAFGAAPIVVGVVAQYLELHPEATPSQIKRALQETGSQHAVTGAGPATRTTTLVYTNLTEPEPVVAAGGGGDTAASSGGGGSSGLSTGAVVGIVILGVACVVLAAAAVFVVRTRKKRRLSSSSQLKPLGPTDISWLIDASDVEVCRRPDGSPWLLGEGRYGRVYKALKGGVQVVAVKKLSRVDENIRARFNKEADMLRMLSRDANMVQFYGCVIDGDDMMLVTEYLEGGDLRAALSGPAGADLLWHRRGKEVALDVVRGLNFLHANGVVHRDIKSGNVLLARDGRAKVGDVGLATLLAGQEARGGEAKAAVGTLAWAAPEALLRQGCTEKADIYSCGVLLWELATGGAPRRGCMRRVGVPHEGPQELADVIEACMQQDPAARPTARELHALLLACPCLADEDSSRSPPTPNEGSLGSREVSTEAPTAGAATARALGEAQASGASSLERVGATGSGTGGGNSGSASLSSPLASSELGLITLDLSKIEFCTNPNGSRQELGRGSFGAVYRALLEGVQPLAAKVVELGTNPSVESVFLQEAGLLWRLRHRNIVGLSGVSVSGSQGILFMELMEGGSLHDMLRVVSKTTKRRLFSWYNRGAKVALDIARGLHYLHSLRITHFDLKSGNVLLTREFSAKIADVGLARVLSCTHHSLGDETMGTFAYMSPELMAGAKCNQSVDIFALGVLIWEICTGTHPVRGRQMDMKIPEECPQEVFDLFVQCTCVDPTGRPSARDVVERLTELEAQQAQQARKLMSGWPMQATSLPAQLPAPLRAVEDPTTAVPPPGKGAPRHGATPVASPAVGLQFADRASSVPSLTVAMHGRQAAASPFTQMQPQQQPQQQAGPPPQQPQLPQQAQQQAAPKSAAVHDSPPLQSPFTALRVQPTQQGSQQPQQDASPLLPPRSAAVHNSPTLQSPFTALRNAS